MKKKYDVIIIGAGVIGAAIGFQMADRGHKTLNIDKLGAAGHGSTSNSCAIIRTHYSTYDGVAMAYENYFYWKDWADFLGVEDETGLIVFHNTGGIMFNAPDSNWPSIRRHYDNVGVEYEEWSPGTFERTDANLLHPLLLATHSP